MFAHLLLSAFAERYSCLRMAKGPKERGKREAQGYFFSFFFSLSLHFTSIVPPPTRLLQALSFEDCWITTDGPTGGPGRTRSIGLDVVLAERGKRARQPVKTNKHMTTTTATARAVKPEK